MKKFLLFNLQMASDLKDTVEIVITKVMKSSIGSIMYYHILLPLNDQCYNGLTEMYCYKLQNTLDYISKLKKKKEMLSRRKCDFIITYKSSFEKVWPRDYPPKFIELKVSQTNLVDWPV
jgi:hypothetical protein